MVKARPSKHDVSAEQRRKDAQDDEKKKGKTGQVPLLRRDAVALQFLNHKT